MRTQLNFLLGAALLTAVASHAAQPAVSYKDLKYPAMNSIQVPEPVRYELPNGMVVYLVENHELPTVDVSAIIRVGSRWEPVDKAGLAAITGEVMRTGGTPTRSGDQLDEELDRLGAQVETGIGGDSGGASVSVLTEDLDRGMEILADLLQHPAFPEEKIELAKIGHRDAIARRNDQPSAIIGREFDRILYGKDTAYGHQTEYATLDAITRADLVTFHRNYFQPENVILGAWGDFKTGEMRARIEKYFGGWGRGGKPRPTVPAVDPGAATRAGLFFIEKDDVNEATVQLGHRAGQRNDPDYFALRIMDYILGGGFSSRLFSNVRSEMGLAYAVGSRWGAGWDAPGSFEAGGGTKSESTVKFLQAVKREVVRMTETEVTNQEINNAKDAILKGFAFEFDSTAKIVGRLLRYEYYGYPRDYLQRFRENIDKVTKADVLRVAKKHLRPDQMVMLVLGKSKDFDQPLATLGSVTAWDITIPPPKSSAPPVAEGPGATDAARALLEKTRAAMGGDALRKLRNHVAKLEINLSTPQGELAMTVETTVVPFNRMLSRMSSSFGEMAQGYDG